MRLDLRDLVDRHLGCGLAATVHAGNLDDEVAPLNIDDIRDRYASGQAWVPQVFPGLRLGNTSLFELVFVVGDAERKKENRRAVALLVHRLWIQILQVGHDGRIKLREDLRVNRRGCHIVIQADDVERRLSAATRDYLGKEVRGIGILHLDLDAGSAGEQVKSIFLKSVPEGSSERGNLERDIRTLLRRGSRHGHRKRHNGGDQVLQDSHRTPPWQYRSSSVWSRTAVPDPRRDPA